MNYVVSSIVFSMVFMYIERRSQYFARYFGVERQYIALDAKGRSNWDQLTVSLVHALIAVPISMKINYDSVGQDPVYYYSDLIYYQFIISGGYFLWDLKVGLSAPDLVGRVMVFHACCGVLATQYVNLLHGGPLYACFTAKLFLYELSTIPLNIKGFLQVVNPKSKFYEWTLLSFAVSFILVRCIWGVYTTLNMLIYIYPTLDSYPMDKNMVLIGETMATSLMNLYWGGLIMTKVLQRFGRRPSSTSSSSSSSSSSRTSGISIKHD
ncbi:hypothetical protein SAMD00019534_042920 [Acytostelium subglobosum LB1]|uniref:hypothetical protein n=1 Tax=Acytostelium subglobosum LB1 TaxID=1410327 RepID=UPI000644EFCA|nr:hypothetical protein SAMD00019534_042920 [Acytostelium subglobosum LB1]GAM21117.1 hypothetical protein SAMD00019534_042920 [Acytostelium subglobosum LB1]|eukprot:XP_012756251.1 hypothetical protein SAMD00019534_042920 [Acytostelium subglobosum LB1]